MPRWSAGDIKAPKKPGRPRKAKEPVPEADAITPAITGEPPPLPAGRPRGRTRAQLAGKEQPPAGLGPAEEKLSALKALCEEIGLPDAHVRAFIRRVRSRVTPTLAPGTKLTLREEIEEIDRKRATMLSYMDEHAMASADLKSLTIAFGVLTDKGQLLKGLPTQRIDHVDRSRLEQLMPAFLEEARRRGLTLPGEFRDITDATALPPPPKTGDERA